MPTLSRLPYVAALSALASAASADEPTWRMLGKAGNITITGQFQDNLPLMEQMPGSFYPGWPQSWSQKNLVFSTPIHVNQQTSGTAGCGSFIFNHNSLRCNTPNIYSLDGVNYPSYITSVRIGFSAGAGTISTNFVASDEFGLPGYLSGNFILPLSEAANRFNGRGQQLLPGDTSHGYYGLKNGTYHFDRISMVIGGHWYGPKIPADLLNVTVSISGAVPEPTAWIALIAGFGLIGSVQRARRTQTSVQL